MFFLCEGKPGLDAFLAFDNKTASNLSTARLERRSLRTLESDEHGVR